LTGEIFGTCRGFASFKLKVPQVHLLSRPQLTVYLMDWTHVHATYSQAFWLAKKVRANFIFFLRYRLWLS